MLRCLPYQLLTRVAYGGSTNVDLAYDLMNRVASIADPLGTNSFLYDAEGQITNKSAAFSVPGFSNVAYLLWAEF